MSFPLSTPETTDDEQDQPITADLPIHHRAYLKQLVTQEARYSYGHEETMLRAIFRLAFPPLLDVTRAAMFEHGIHIQKPTTTLAHQEALRVQQDLVLRTVLGEDWAQDFPLNY